MTRRHLHTTLDIGAGIRDARLALGLTQAQLAARADVSREWLIGIEQGRRTRAEITKLLAVIASLDLDLILETSPSVAEKHEDDDASRGAFVPPLSTNEITRRAMQNLRGPAGDSAHLLGLRGLDPDTNASLGNLMPRVSPALIKLVNPASVLAAGMQCEADGVEEDVEENGS